MGVAHGNRAAFADPRAMVVNTFMAEVKATVSQLSERIKVCILDTSAIKKAILLDF